MMLDKTVLLEREEVGRAVARMAHEIVEKAGPADDLVLLGIRSRGVHLARRLARQIQAFARVAPLVGAIDVRRYRDDRTEEDASATAPVTPALSIDDKTVVLVDDVIFRGRTIRAAIEALARWGVPKRVLVAVLIDRGARELPIRADVVGKNVDADETRRVNVRFEESDGIDQVVLSGWEHRARL